MARKKTDTTATATQNPADGLGGDNLRITSKREGFRRAGRAWSVTPIVVAADDLTPEQLAQLRAEPMLTVETL